MSISSCLASFRQRLDERRQVVRVDLENSCIKCSSASACTRLYHRFAECGAEDAGISSQPRRYQGEKTCLLPLHLADFQSTRHPHHDESIRPFIQASHDEWISSFLRRPSAKPLHVSPWYPIASGFDEPQGKPSERRGMSERAKVWTFGDLHVAELSVELDELLRQDCASLSYNCPLQCNGERQ